MRRRVEPGKHPRPTANSRVCARSPSARVIRSRFGPKPRLFRPRPGVASIDGQKRPRTASTAGGMTPKEAHRCSITVAHHPPSRPTLARLPALAHALDARRLRRLRARTRPRRALPRHLPHLRRHPAQLRAVPRLARRAMTRAVPARQGNSPSSSRTRSRRTSSLRDSSTTRSNVSRPPTRGSGPGSIPTRWRCSTTIRARSASTPRARSAAKSPPS